MGGGGTWTTLSGGGEHCSPALRFPPKRPRPKSESVGAGSVKEVVVSLFRRRDVALFLELRDLRLEKIVGFGLDRAE